MKTAAVTALVILVGLFVSWAALVAETVRRQSGMFVE